MWEKIFIDNNNWENFGGAHLLSFLIFASLGFAFIYLAKTKLNEDQKHRYLLYFCLFLWTIQYSKIFIKLYLGVFDYHKDLPFELCNMLPIFMSLASYYRSRKWWGILFLWIMIGTFQANITTTLQDAFPHYEFFRYWIVHMGLTTAALYGVFVFGYRATLKDAWKAFLWLNVVAWSMFVVNKFLDSNYMYMQAKPPGDTIYNLLSEWPIYLVQLQFLMWILILITLIPFWILKYFKR